MRDLINICETHIGKVSDKWSLYISEYDKLFTSVRSKKIRLLEIGVQNGGSLEIWSKYFYQGDLFVGCDINPSCALLQYDDKRVNVIVGDANSDLAYSKITAISDKFDLIIDDGSHTSSDIIKSFIKYFPHLADDGLFIVEDLHCSYWKAFEGGLYHPYSSMSFFKRLVDVVNFEHWGVETSRVEALQGFADQFMVTLTEDLLAEIHSIEFINSMCVIRKSKRNKNILGHRIFSGQNALVIPQIKTQTALNPLTPNEYQNEWSVLGQSPDEAYQRIVNSLRSAKEAITAKNIQLSDLSRTLDHVYASKSWRITKPLRWASNQIKRLRNDGFATRLNAFLQKSKIFLLTTTSNYIKSRPLLRNFVLRFSEQVGLKTFLMRLYRHQLSVANEHPDTRYKPDSHSYAKWSTKFDTPDEEFIQLIESMTDTTSKIFVVVHIEPTSLSYVKPLIDALQANKGQNWVTLFVNDERNLSSEFLTDLKTYAKGDPRFIFEKSTPIPEDANLFIYIEAGVIPRCHALYAFAESMKKNPHILAVYSDEDHINCDGTISDPWFKPKFSPLLASQNLLLGGMLALRKPVGTNEGLFSELLSKPNHQKELIKKYLLGLTPEEVHHIPHVLYHDHRERSISPSEALRTANYSPATIIIPTKNRWDLLEPCLKSIELTTWPTEMLEVIVVDNGSTDQKTLSMLDHLARQEQIKVIKDTSEFNWSKLNNTAVQKTQSDLLVFLNNDTEIIDPDWLIKLAFFALQDDVGAVGCKLLYPDKTVQHGGVIAGIQGVAGHAHLFNDTNDGGYCNLANVTHEVSAVTGACLAVSRKHFMLAGGFNEDLRVAFNDIDFCFKLQKFGLRNIYVSDPLIIHHESKSRGLDDTPQKLALQQSEARKTWRLHPDIMREDPYYSPNLSLYKPYLIAAAPRRRAIWDDPTSRRTRVLMLSSTHAIGHGVAVVLALQAKALVKQKFDVFIGGPISENDFAYEGCVRLDVSDPAYAVELAAELSIDIIVAHTPPFYSVARWTGNHPKVISYDYGEPPPEYFDNAEQRRALLAEKDTSLLMAHKVYAISEAIANESRTPVHGVIPLGNAHLGRWRNTLSLRRSQIRAEHGWENSFVILNVCRFHQGERKYKGIDSYIAVKELLQTNFPELYPKAIFIICGKGTDGDIAELEALGLQVHANVTDEEMFDLYTAADAYMNFSKWEGYNLGIGQALAMGLPSIASDIPAHNAFGIETTCSTKDACEWLAHQIQNPMATRVAKLWTWEQPLQQLVNAISEF